MSLQCTFTWIKGFSTGCQTDKSFTKNHLSKYGLLKIMVKFGSFLTYDL